MVEKFCPKCGRKTEKFYKNLCEECFLSTVSLSKIFPEKILVRRCRDCGRYFINKIRSSSLENSIEAFLEKFLKKEEIVAISYSIENEKVYLNLTSKVEGLEKKEEKIVKIEFRLIICQACSMKASGYFQAVLQVRAPSDLIEEIKKDVERQVEILKDFDELAFISRKEERKSGIDFFFGSKNSANQIARYLKAKHGGKIKITRKFAGYVKGRKVYRDTILISISS